MHTRGMCILRDTKYQTAIGYRMVATILEHCTSEVFEYSNTVCIVGVRRNTFDLMLGFNSIQTHYAYNCKRSHLLNNLRTKYMHMHTYVFISFHISEFTSYMISDTPPDPTYISSRISYCHLLIKTHLSNTIVFNIQYP